MSRSRDIANLLGSSSPIVDKTIIDAKGDLLIGSADNTVTKLAAGSTGQLPLVDSSTSSGLRYVDNYSTKNWIINGDFSVNQRNFTSNTSNGTYNFDRWFQQNSASCTVTPQTFTPGSAPVAGIEGKNFARIVTSGHSGLGDYAQFTQWVEDVRVLSGQTATLSFWAKAGSGTPSVAIELIQYFGTGGSPSSNVLTYANKVTLSTSWSRYTVTVDVPSIAGKTIGTAQNTSAVSWSFWLSAGSNFNSRTGSLGVQNNTFDIWGVQLEAGPVASRFSEEPYSEVLRKCQRYYYVHAIGNNQIISLGSYYTSGSIYGVINFPVTMRIKPTYVTTVGTDYYVIWRNGGGDYFNNFSDTTIGSTNSTLWGNVVEMSGTAGQVGDVRTSNASSLVAFSAEL